MLNYLTTNMMQNVSQCLLPEEWITQGMSPYYASMHPLELSLESAYFISLCMLGVIPTNLFTTFSSCFPRFPFI